MNTGMSPRDGAGWRCADPGLGVAPEIFSPSSRAEWLAAKAVCADCARRVECLALGREHHEWGVWGGVLLQNGRPVRTPRPDPDSVGAPSRRAARRAA